MSYSSVGLCRTSQRLKSAILVRVRLLHANAIMVERTAQYSGIRPGIGPKSLVGARLMCEDGHTNIEARKFRSKSCYDSISEPDSHNRSQVWAT
jgi:hypothetical protein